MDAGTLDRRVVIEAKTTVQDAYGQPIETWNEVAKAWMGKRRMTGREQMAVGPQELASETVVWFGRYIAGLTPGDMRLVAEGKIYDIQNVAEIGRRDGLEITATAVRV